VCVAEGGGCEAGEATREAEAVAAEMLEAGEEVPDLRAPGGGGGAGAVERGRGRCSRAAERAQGRRRRALSGGPVARGAGEGASRGKRCCTHGRSNFPVPYMHCSALNR
jgi:hypothetical protein